MLKTGDTALPHRTNCSIKSSTRATSACAHVLVQLRLTEFLFSPINCAHERLPYPSSWCGLEFNCEEVSRYSSGLIVSRLCLHEASFRLQRTGCRLLLILYSRFRFFFLDVPQTLCREKAANWMISRVGNVWNDQRGQRRCTTASRASCIYCKQHGIV